MEVHIKTIPHSEQRYNTAGDYLELPSGIELITVSELPDWRYEFLVALHEFIEFYLTKSRNIPEPSISAFDLAHLESDDPGMLPDSPYRREHTFATAIEMLLADQLGVDWLEYQKSFEGLIYETSDH